MWTVPTSSETDARERGEAAAPLGPPLATGGRAFRMGVPSFFRWVSLRYPRCVVAADDALECDHLYLDMNGIIHPAFHPEDGPQPSSEDEVFVAILARIEALVAVAQPRKLLYLAVDGPAPRAKMNQQRSRRFRAAHEAERSRLLAERLRARFREDGRAGEAPPAPPEPMDPNVITPGTEFMARLGRWLRHWAHATLNASPPPPYRIILSDASVPGEGEHKAVAYIRAQRHASGYDPNTRHVIHGLDADLIMLALVTHEPNFAILREKQGHRGRKGGRGGGAGGGGGGEAEVDADGESFERLRRALEDFEVVRVDTLREYLEREMRGADWSGVRGGFDLERAIDDFVLLCFFVGNDFLPHMPGMDIKQGAIDALLLLYKRHVSSRLRGYLTSNGEVNLPRLGALLQVSRSVAFAP